MKAQGHLWANAALAIAALSVDPIGLGGLAVRARAGPVRKRCLKALTESLPLPIKRLHPSIDDTALFGGVDIAASLGQKHVIRTPGILAYPAALFLPMAERTPHGLAARLSQALDRGADHCVIALDEGADPEEHLPDALLDRLGLHIDLETIGLSDALEIDVKPDLLAEARDLLPHIKVPSDVPSQMVRVASELGISSLRAPLFALRLARVSAALMGEQQITESDLHLAVELGLAPKATVFPAPPSETPAEDTTQKENGQQGPENETHLVPDDVLLEAARAILPANLLEHLVSQKPAQHKSGLGGAGAAKRGNRRGRPLPSRPGKINAAHRVDLIATLRAAAPWQPFRARLRPDHKGLHIRPEDIRIRYFEETSDRLIIFTVDASGSAAFARLAEAKGAVELLLSEAYARRDYVALIAFRKTGAEVLLPPTRSLVQTKRRLSALAGGGGTPLAAGLQASLGLMEQARHQGLTPTLALLTDGKANITLDGTSDRPQAIEDAKALARLIQAKGIPALVIDVGTRSQPSLADLAAILGAEYLPLPRADATQLSHAVNSALET